MTIYLDLKYVFMYTGTISSREQYITAMNMGVQMKKTSDSKSTRF